jgi:hypothetical protein
VKKNERSFRHERIAYDRPAEAFRCGRAGLWRKPCWQGPAPAGQCQGQSECAPARIGDRWECRRPKLAGGKCGDGPQPDGSCAHRHPPCAPRHSLRRSRGRIAGLALLGLLLVVFMGINPFAPSVVNPLAIDAGELSSVHAGFTRETGCGACHAGHRKDALGWIAAAFRSNDPSAQCLDCHDFAGPPAKVHNAVFPKRPEMGDISCVRCHSEHKGAAAQLSRVPDYTCSNCHQRAFDNFASNHPPFAKNYPYDRPGQIYFDHSRHIAKHFTDPKVLARSKPVAEFAAAARGKCTACHDVQGATREVAPMPFEKICSACHVRDIANGELTVLEPGQMTGPSSVLFGVEKDGDEEEAKKHLGGLWQAMARSGTDALAELAAGGDEAQKKKSAALFAGLSAQTARELGAAWSAKRVASAGGKEGSPGWAARDNAEGRPALTYTPGGHADPVLKAWIEHVSAMARGKDKERRQVAGEALEALIDKDAAGACGKCHGAALRAAPAERVALAWKRAGREPAPHQKYSHGPHLGLVDPDAGCKTCHELNAESGYARYFNAKPGKPQAYQSNFTGIRKEACVECHQEGQVHSACQVCHSYHLPHRFNLGFRKRGIGNEPAAR